MAERRRGIAIRLGLQDDEAVRRALERLGRDGQDALRRLEQGAKGPTSSLRALNAASVEVQSTMTSTASRLGPVGTAMASLGPAATAGAAGLALVFGALSKGVGVLREFEQLQASLETVTGSAAAADAAFAQIKTFATTTPYSLEEVTQAFIKLKALGLDPSTSALQSYGNTASAMGKSLNQFIEAVADAATGEFQRLKEFGITARTEGDIVTFTFRGMSTTVRKEASAIEGYLRNLGQVEFAGGMERQVNTLDGQFSNLTDSVRILLAELAKVSGARDVVSGTVRGMTEAANAATKALEMRASLSAKILSTQQQIAGIEGEIGQFRAGGMPDTDPEIASRIPILAKLYDEEKKLIAEGEAQVKAALAERDRVQAEGDKRVADAAAARTTALKEMSAEQRKALEMARLDADRRAEIAAADKAEADLKDKVADATADEIDTVRARAVEVVRAERETAAAARASADAQRDKERATSKAVSEMKRAREEAERLASADAKAIRGLRDELALLSAGSDEGRRRIEREQVVRDAREPINQPELRDEAGRLAGAAFDQEQENRLRQAGKQVFDETRTAAEQYAERLTDLNKLVQAGAIDYDTYARATAKAREEMKRAESGAGDLSSALLGGLGHALTALRGDFKNFGEVAISVLQHVILELIRMQEAARATGKSGPLSGIFDAIGGAIGGLFGGGGSVFGIGGSMVPDAASVGIPGGGFAHGGSFRVGGMGGVDSQVVSFRATPGERVDIRTPATASGMSGDAAGPINYYTVDARGANDPGAVEAAVARGIALATPGIVKRATANTLDKFERSRRVPVR